MSISNNPESRQAKIEGSFYPLQEKELRWLKQHKMIKNTAYTYLALKIENPFCDRPLKIKIKEFALRWGIPESSVYECIAKLKELQSISIQSKEIVITWRTDDSQQGSVSGNPESIPRIQNQFRESRINSENSESIPKTQNQFRELRTDIYKDRGCAQTSSDSDQTHTNAPPEPGAPPTQETVCVESKDSELKRESTAVNPCDEQPDKTSSLTTTVSGKTKDATAPRENSSRHQKNLDHSEPLPWETDESPRKFNTGFEEWMQRSLSHYPAYQGLTSGEMVTKIRKHISAGKYDEKRRDALEIEWAAYQDSMKPKPTSQPPVATSGDINKKPSPEEEATRLRNFRIKFLKSIPEGRVMFIPKWTAKAVQDKELALSDIPQWIQESIQESMEF